MLKTTRSTCSLVRFEFFVRRKHCGDAKVVIFIFRLADTCGALSIT